MEHSFNTKIARKYGFIDAIILRQIQNMVELAQIEKVDKYDNRTWVKLSTFSLAKECPYLSNSQIRKTMEKLVKIGVLLKKNLNQDYFDHTLWYAFSNEEEWGLSDEA